MARRYDSKEAKRRILTACVRLFLEKGYTNTKVAEILKEADVSAGSFQNIFRTKDGVLTELIGMMFSRQFGAVRPLAANAPSPVYLYAVETALQLALTELSENLRDIYVEAYTFPATAEIIHRSTTAELQAAFSAYLPGCAECDFYEMELGTAGMMRGYMALYAGAQNTALSEYEPECAAGPRAGARAGHRFCGGDRYACPGAEGGRCRACIAVRAV